MTYIITKVDINGNKFGERGDAEITIYFELPNVPDDAYEFALMLVKEDNGKFSKYFYGSGDEGVKIVRNCLIYRPRFSYTSTEPSTWKLKTLDELLGVIREFSERMESVLPRTVAPIAVYEMIRANKHLNGCSMDWIPQEKKWRVHIVMRQPSSWEANRTESWSTLLDRTYYDPTRRINAERNFVFSEEELGQLNSEWLNKLVVEMAAEINERSVRNAALRKLEQKLRTKQLQCTHTPFLSASAKEVDVWSSYVKEKRKITWLNGFDLMQQVEALDVEKLATEMGHTEALAIAEEQRRQMLAEDAEERKANKAAKKVAKAKLEEDWAMLLQKARELQTKVSR